MTPVERTPLHEPALALALLGGFDLRRRDGATIELPTRKTQLLLAYLALPAGLAHTREKLASLFWGNRQEEQARGSLRNALAAVRAAIGAETLIVDRDCVELASGSIAVDVDRLVQAASAERGPLERLAAGLRCELLDGLGAPSEAFADWLAFERTRCRGLVVAAAQSAVAALTDERR